MAGQTQVSPIKRSSASPPQAVAPSVGGVAQNVAALAELQVELLRAEARHGARWAVACGVLLAAAVLAAIGCVPVALAGGAIWLMQTAKLSPAACFAWAAMAGAAFAAASAGVAWQLWRRSPLTFQRTRHELARNFRWISQMFHDPRDSKGEPDHV